METLSDCLLNKNGKEALPARFRALFALGALKTDEAVGTIGRAFGDPSVLLKHELAYVLGQMQNPHAIPILANILSDVNEHPMVRHEAAEALGAIGEPSSVSILRMHASDPEPAISETCQIAIDRIVRNEMASQNAAASSGEIEFGSIDPAPPFKERLATEELGNRLMDLNASLYDRYKAMFSLRNRAASDPTAILQLCRGFSDKSALFRHEIAYVLGQLQHPSSIPSLCQQLETLDEAPMVRHECAEALGSIATPECLEILNRCKEDAEIVVRESCVVALDMYDYENSNELHFYKLNNSE